MAETLYKGSNTAVKVASTVIPRAQEFSISVDRTAEAEYELGNESPAGTSTTPWMYTGRLSFHPISTLTERAMIAQEATAGYVVKLADIMGATGLAITSPAAGLTGAVATGVEYSVSVPNGKWTCNMDLKATGISGITTVTAPAVAGVGAYRAKHIYVRCESLVSNLLRVRSITASARYSAEDDYQLSSADPFAIFASAPNVTAQIEWYLNTESVNPGTNATDLRPVLEDASGVDFEVQVVPAGSSWDSVGNLRMMLQNMTTDKRNIATRVQQRGTYQISYVSGGDSTTYGWTVDYIAA